MSPEVGQAAVRFGLFLIIAAALALPWTARQSAEFVILVLTIGIGLLLLAMVALFARLWR